jgi:hypothetical protein
MPNHLIPFSIKNCIYNQYTDYVFCSVNIYETRRGQPPYQGGTGGIYRATILIYC